MFCRYRLDQLQHLTWAILWLGTAEYVYMVTIKTEFVNHNVIPFIYTPPSLSDTSLNFRPQQCFTVLHCRHKMISDLINSMCSLSQFHPNCMIIPQTPFSKGEFKVSPQQRLWGIANLNNTNAEYLALTSDGAYCYAALETCYTHLQ
jgi:hypothetical protein